MEPQPVIPDARLQPVVQPRLIEPRPHGERASRRWPALALALAALVVLAAIGYGAAAQLVRMPLLNPDELRYTLAARGLVGGEWLNLRGDAYGYGPVYPLLLAPILALAGSLEVAYPLFKLADAVLFGLVAVPVYFLARRLLPEWWSVAVAATAILIPSSIYTSVVLTESTAYLASSAALLAVVVALEHPTVPRQLVMLAIVGLAYATRPQFAALLPAFVAGAVLLWAVDAGRPPLRRAAARLWPALGALALGLAVGGAGLLVTRSSPSGSLGGYANLWREYDPAAVAQFLVYHLAGWELYLFVVPFVAAPIVVRELLQAARRGAEREGAFVAAFLTVNTVTFLVAAAFATTPYGFSELHDRYLFYVAPLWLVAFAVWLERGLPRPPVLTAVSALVALVLPASLPFGLIGGNLVLEVVPTALWSLVWDVVEGAPHVDGRRVLGLVVIVLVVAAVALPRRAWPLLPAVVLAGFLLTATLAWKRQVDAPLAFVQADRDAGTWVDDALPQGAQATKLYVSPPRCPYTEMVRHALFLTEFFNRSVERVAAIGDSTSDGLPAARVDVGAGGRLLLAGGDPLVADYVVTQPEVALAGRRIARGTGAGLVLWRTDGAVRLAGPSLTTRAVLAGYCG